MPRKRRVAARRKGNVAADEAVYGAIRRAMHLGRLAAGTKLQEPVLARVLKVSRERVRKALHRLVHEGWLVSVPNRGTFVPSLTVEEMREIYDVRSMLEAAIVRRLGQGLTAVAAKRLRAHITEERQALRNRDRGWRFQLSGDFHILLSELCGNGELTKLMRALLTRSTMHFSLVAPDEFHDCAGPHDHGDIVAALLQGKAERASKLMLAHLGGLADMQGRRPRQATQTDLQEAFRGTLQK